MNTGRSCVLDAAAALRALDTRQLGFLSLNVYEGGEGLFFARHCMVQLLDKTFERLLSFPNVLVTGHPACLTREALTNIANATMACFDTWDQGRTAGATRRGRLRAGYRDTARRGRGAGRFTDSYYPAPQLSGQPVSSQRHGKAPGKPPHTRARTARRRAGGRYRND